MTKQMDLLPEGFITHPQYDNYAGNPEGNIIKWLKNDKCWVPLNPTINAKEGTRKICLKKGKRRRPNVHVHRFMYEIKTQQVLPYGRGHIAYHNSWRNDVSFDNVYHTGMEDGEYSSRVINGWARFEKEAGVWQLFVGIGQKSHYVDSYASQEEAYEAFQAELHKSKEASLEDVVSRIRSRPKPVVQSNPVKEKRKLDVEKISIAKDLKSRCWMNTDCLLMAMSYLGVRSCSQRESEKRVEGLGPKFVVVSRTKPDYRYFLGDFFRWISLTEEQREVHDPFIERDFYEEVNKVVSGKMDLSYYGPSFSEFRESPNYEDLKKAMGYPFQKLEASLAKSPPKRK